MRFVLLTRRQKGIGVPSVPRRLRRQQRKAMIRQRAAEGQYIFCGTASAVEQDECSSGLLDWCACPYDRERIARCSRRHWETPSSDACEVLCSTMGVNRA